MGLLEKLKFVLSLKGDYKEVPPHSKWQLSTLSPRLSLFYHQTQGTILLFNLFLFHPNSFYGISPIWFWVWPKCTCISLSRLSLVLLKSFLLNIALNITLMCRLKRGDSIFYGLETFFSFSKRCKPSFVFLGSTFSIFE